MTRPSDLWHAVHRGAPSRPVFGSRADCVEFLELVAACRERLPVEVHAFCLMGSHYHLLLRARNTDVARFLGQVEGEYARRFDGPFRAGSIRAEAHLVHASRYIHRNPVGAGLVERAEEWPFSSYAAYLDPALAPSWLTTSRILQAFGSVGARRLYRAFVEADRRRDFLVLDGEEFRAELSRRAALDLPLGRGATVLRPTVRTPLDRIARAVSETFEVPVASLRGVSGAQGPAPGLARGAFVHAAQSVGGHRLQEIAAWMGYGSRSAAARVAMRFAREARRDPRHLSRLAAVRRRLSEVPTSV